MIREELEFMGPTVNLGRGNRPQQNIVKIVRRLEAENKVVVSRGAGEVRRERGQLWKCTVFQS